MTARQRQDGSSASLFLHHVSSIRELQTHNAPYDAIIVAAGAAVGTLPEVGELLPLRLCYGETLVMAPPTASTSSDEDTHTRPHLSSSDLHSGREPEGAVVHYSPPAAQQNFSSSSSSSNMSAESTNTNSNSFDSSSPLFRSTLEYAEHLNSNSPVELHPASPVHPACTTLRESTHTAAEFSSNSPSLLGQPYVAVHGHATVMIGATKEYGWSADMAMALCTRQAAATPAATTAAATTPTQVAANSKFESSCVGEGTSSAGHTATPDKSPKGLLSSSLRDGEVVVSPEASELLVAAQALWAPIQHWHVSEVR